jgi:hypothetical protein
MSTDLKYPIVFQHPFRFLIAGPSQSGKSVFTSRLLRNIDYIQPAPERIIWAYGEANIVQFDNIQKTCSKNIEFIQGVPDTEMFDANEKNLLIIDDLMEAAGKSSKVADLFTKGSHHRNLSVILIVQNIFHQGRRMRDISLNSSYIALFKNPRDNRQIMSLGSQIYPQNPKFITDAYMQCTRRPHGYLLINLTQHASDELRFLTGIFPPEYPIAYIPKM